MKNVLPYLACVFGVLSPMAFAESHFEEICYTLAVSEVEYYVEYYEECGWWWDGCETLTRQKSRIVYYTDEECYTQCQPGWQPYPGNCDVPICDPSCSAELTCVAPDTCIYTTTTSVTTSTPKTTTAQPGPCNPNPCRNGATCNTQGTNDYTCNCVAGFTSYRCDAEINECEPAPCYPFGTCNDLLNDYNCSCNPGFGNLTDNAKHCTAINYCESAYCQNGGSCVNQPELTRYYCKCPSGYAGLQCEKDLGAVQHPEVTAIQPDTGIRAGGSNISILGTNMNEFEALGAFLVDTSESGTLKPVYAFVIPNLTSSDMIVVRTPPVEENYVYESLAVIVEYSGPRNVTKIEDNYRFQFVSNPVIERIEPNIILATGGIHLTVSGTNVAIVEQAMMDVSTIVYNKTEDSIYSNYSCQICLEKNEGAIKCILPLNLVPPAFHESDNSGNLHGIAHYAIPDPSSNHRRRKRAPVANLTDQHGSTFELYLGFIFDDLPTYENISKSIPTYTLTLVESQINFLSNQVQPIIYDPSVNPYVEIHGDKLTYGCGQDDYTVTISDALGQVVDLKDTLLKFKPPEKEPALSEDSKQLCMEHHVIKVVVGGVPYMAGCLDYISSVDVALIVGIVVPIAIVLIAAIVVTLILLKRRRMKEDERRLRNIRTSCAYNGGYEETNRGTMNGQNIYCTLQERNSVSSLTSQKDAPVQFHSPHVAEQSVESNCMELLDFDDFPIGESGYDNIQVSASSANNEPRNMQIPSGANVRSEYSNINDEPRNVQSPPDANVKSEYSNINQEPHNELIPSGANVNSDYVNINAFKK